MFHFTYITASRGGFYYIGRHSTKNINDGYLGSGNWVRYCKNNNIELHRKIINFYPSFENLLEGEELLLSEHIFNYYNMNLTTKSIGFAVGDLNPAKSEKERIRRSNFNWMKTDEGREWFSINNPSKKEEVKKIKSTLLKKRWLDKSYRDMMETNHHSKTSVFREFFSKNNPMKNEEVKDKIRAHVKKQLASGNHSSQIKASCICCKKTVSISNLGRWHRACLSNNSTL